MKDQIYLIRATRAVFEPLGCSGNGIMAGNLHRLVLGRIEARKKCRRFAEQFWRLAR